MQNQQLVKKCFGIETGGFWTIQVIKKKSDTCVNCQWHKKGNSDGVESHVESIMLERKDAVLTDVTLSLSPSSCQLCSFPTKTMTITKLFAAPTTMRQSADCKYSLDHVPTKMN